MPLSTEGENQIKKMGISKKEFTTGCFKTITSPEDI